MVDAPLCEGFEIRGKSDEEIVVVAEVLRSPSDFGDGEGAGESHVFAVGESFHVFGPDISLDTEDSMNIFGLDFGDDRVETVDLLEGEVAADGKRFLGRSGLVIVEIHVTGWGHYDVLSEIGGGDAPGCATPAHDGGTFGESALQDFIPSDEASSVLVEVVFHLLNEPGLEFVFVFEAPFSDALLLGGVVFPLGFGAFITADVDEFAGEDFHDFGQDIAAELDSFRFGVEDSVTDAPAGHDFGGFAVA